MMMAIALLMSTGGFNAFMFYPFLLTFTGVSWGHLRLTLLTLRSSLEVSAFQKAYFCAVWLVL